MTDNRWTAFAALTSAVGAAVNMLFGKTEPNVDMEVRLALLERRVEQLEDKV